MRTSLSRIAAAVGAACCLACVQQDTGAPVSRVGTVPPEGLVLVNARILDGAGGVREGATLVVRDGRIVSIGDTADAPGALEIDAAGLTVMPGLIDAHRHIIRGDADAWLLNEARDRMREFLEAGFTTVLSAIDDEDGILELRRRVADGELTGPRILSAAVAPVSRPAPGGGGGGAPGGDPARGDQRAPRRPGALPIPPDETRARIQQIADRGFDAVKVILAVTPGGPEQETLALIVEEASRLGLPTITHAVSVEDTLAAVAAGTPRLVHTPHVGQLTLEQAAAIGGAGVPMTSTLGVFVPFFNDDNEAIFRDALPYPWINLLSAGQGPVNARLLWEAGTVYAFGTDTTFLPKETLAHELTSLRSVFSPRDLVTILTRNAAIFIGREADLGVVEAGKVADLLVVEGDPASDIYDVLDVAMVVKDGQIVVDNGQAR